MTAKILIVPGSARTGSLNAKLAAVARKELAIRDAEVTLISLADYEMPVFNADLEAETGRPPTAARNLAVGFAAQDGILIVSPEYNAGIPPLVKNTLDWISRVKEPDVAPYADRVFALAAASPGRFGGMRSLLMLRQTLEVGLGALVIPQMFSLSRAREAFDADGSLADAATAGRFARMLDAFLAHVRRARAWSR